MNPNNLKQALLRGGLYLTLRQIITVILSLISVLVITRHLGPEHYGWSIIAVSYNTFMTSLASLGLKIYLIRKPGECAEQLQGEILTFLMITSSVLAIVSVITAPIISTWSNIPELKLILPAMAPAILLDSAVGVPLGMLERRLEYQRSSIAEIGSLLFYYIAAIPLVLIGWDIWGIVAAYVLSSLFQTTAAFFCCPIRPFWLSDLKELRIALSYGFSFSTAMWILQGRGLIVPLLISKFIGAEAVGLIGATTRIVDLLTFVKAIAWQLGISGFAKLQEDMPAMRKALNRAIVYQSLLMTMALGLFACFSSTLIPLVLGLKWNSIITLFPFVAFAFLIKGIFDLHSLVLFSMGHNIDVLKFNIVQTVILCSVIIAAGKPFHIWGYIAAELLALIAYTLLHWSVYKIVGSPNYKPLLIIISITTPILLTSNKFFQFVALIFWIISFILIYLLSPEVRIASRELMTSVISKLPIK